MRYAHNNGENSVTLAGPVVDTRGRECGTRTCAHTYANAANQRTISMCQPQAPVISQMRHSRSGGDGFTKRSFAAMPLVSEEGTQPQPGDETKVEWCMCWCALDVCV